jgi:hypothetical protein
MSQLAKAPAPAKGEKLVYTAKTHTSQATRSNIDVAINLI